MPYPDVILVGGIALRLWVLTALLGAAVALRVAGAEARRQGVAAPAVQDALLTLMVGAAAGATLLHPLANVVPVLQPLAGAGPLSPWGALLGLGAAAILEFRAMSLPLWRFLDAIAPAISLGLALSLLGTSVVGRPTDLPWGVSYGGVGSFHPMSLYFVLAALGGYVLSRPLVGRTTFAGQFFLLTVFFGAMARLLLEWAAASPPWLGPVTVPQVVSLAVGLAALIAYRWRERRAVANGTGEAPHRAP